MARPGAPAIDEVMRRSKSNLAFALACLPPEPRRDMMTFYAFCRVVDDIADEPEFSLKDRRIQLGAWRRTVRGEQMPAGEVAREVVKLPQKYGFSESWLEEIIDGVSMDLERCRYATFDDLAAYCHKVAGVVGLVSLSIFGVRDPAARDYAINLGQALQLTNILRDLRDDWENEQRLYLPTEDLVRFGYFEPDIAAHRYNRAFDDLMRFESDRALEFFARAVAAFPRSEARKLLAAEAMRKIYLGIHLKMRRDGFRVFDKRYRLPLLRKAAIVAGTWLRR